MDRSLALLYWAFIWPSLFWGRFLGLPLDAVERPVARFADFFEHLEATDVEAQIDRYRRAR